MVIDRRQQIPYFSRNLVVAGSEVYPEPISFPYFNLKESISFSLVLFARIEAAETAVWLTSALCSQAISRFDRFSIFIFTKSCHFVIFGMVFLFERQ